MGIKLQMKRNRFHADKVNKISTILAHMWFFNLILVKNKADKNENDFGQIIFATENKTLVCCRWGKTD
jgi:hypothetical protein